MTERDDVFLLRFSGQIKKTADYRCFACSSTILLFFTFLKKHARKHRKKLSSLETTLFGQDPTRDLHLRSPFSSSILHPHFPSPFSSSKIAHTVQRTVRITTRPSEILPHDCPSKRQITAAFSPSNPLRCAKDGVLSGFLDAILDERTPTTYRISDARCHFGRAVFFVVCAYEQILRIAWTWLCSARALSPKELSSNSDSTPAQLRLNSGSTRNMRLEPPSRTCFRHASDVLQTCLKCSSNMLQTCFKRASNAHPGWVGAHRSIPPNGICRSRGGS